MDFSPDNWKLYQTTNNKNSLYKMMTWKEIRHTLGGLKNYFAEKKLNRNQIVASYGGRAQWMETFIETRLGKQPRGRWAVIHISGQPLTPIVFDNAKYKIFFTGENVHVPESHWQRYEHLFLENRRVSMSIGFDYNNHPQYCRVPLWLMRHFKPTDTLDDIRARIDGWNSHYDRAKRKKLCAMMCRFDYFGDRAIFADMMEHTIPMTYPGRFRHNDDELHSDKYNDNKFEYLRQFKFNLCPENSDSEGYVTEKIFDAISSGCIPIYWGSGNDPEPGMFNKDAIIFLTLDGDNTEALAKIKWLAENQEAYEEFVKQPYFTPEAPEMIWNMMQQLENKLKEISKK